MSIQGATVAASV